MIIGISELLIRNNLPHAARENSLLMPSLIETDSIASKIKKAKINSAKIKYDFKAKMKYKE
jgi:hypothetical protein